MSFATLISGFEGVRRNRTGTYSGSSPANQDKSPSLAIREADDGRLLVHCFAGCSVEEVLDACGLTFSDLYPDKPIPHAKSERRPFPLPDVLRAISFECDVVVLYAARLGRGE